MKTLCALGSRFGSVAPGFRGTILPVRARIRVLVLAAVLCVLVLPTHKARATEGRIGGCVDLRVVAANGKFRATVGAQGKARLEGLRSAALAALQKTRSGAEKRDIRKTLDTLDTLTKKYMPEDLAVGAAGTAQITVAPEDDAFFEFVANGTATGEIGRLQYFASLHRVLRIETAGAMTEGYLRAGINYSVLRLVSVDTSDAIVYAGNAKGPLQMPLFRVATGTQLVCLNPERPFTSRPLNASYHFVMYVRRDGLVGTGYIDVNDARLVTIGAASEPK